MTLTFLIIVLAVAILLFAVITVRTPAKSVKKRGRAGQVGHVDRALVASRWQTITELAKGNGNDIRHAVMEADKLLDYVMKQQGYAGQTMADRLKIAQKNLKNRNAVWEAHKLRNVLVHEVGFDLVPTQAREALQGFEGGLKDLEAL
ncbi:MAG TPA: hypothetical protein VNA68_00850 [Candidatus Dormibacteraeota bacterium]|nr:hypothetical protein [Candidatus Dormibacteraeota bacterium]